MGRFPSLLLLKSPFSVRVLGKCKSVVLQTPRAAKRTGLLRGFDGKIA